MCWPFSAPAMTCSGVPLPLSLTHATKTTNNPIRMDRILTPMRSAVLALLLGGCLIVKTYDLEDKSCPKGAEPEFLTDSSGAMMLLGDLIYFTRTPNTISSMPKGGGRATDLAQIMLPPRFMVAHGNTLYWATDSAIEKAPVTGGMTETVLDTLTNVTALDVDDVGLVYVDVNLYRLRHDDGTVETISDGAAIAGMVARNRSEEHTSELQSLRHLVC